MILSNLKSEFVSEHKFSKTRKFRFDYANLENKIAIEYEGIYGGMKSRHTSLVGYSKDTEKYNSCKWCNYPINRYLDNLYILYLVFGSSL